MSNRIIGRLCCAALLFSSLQFGLAQSQDSAPAFFFGPPVTPVWDISGTYVITNRLQSASLQPLEFVFQGIDINVNARGRLEGSGTIIVLVGDNPAGNMVGGDYQVAGNISGGGTNTHVNFSIKFKGNGTIAGVATTCNISVKYKLLVTNQKTLAGTYSGSAHFSHLGGGNLKSVISLPLPANVDGGWNVTVYDVPFGSKLSGTAVVQVDADNSDPNESPRVLATKLTGTIPRSGVRKEKLSGTGLSAGTQLNLEYTPLPGVTNAAVNGKVLGQKVKN
jgi:hypothetical protein